MSGGGGLVAKEAIVEQRTMLSGEDARDWSVGTHAHEGKGRAAHVGQKRFEKGEVHGIFDGDGGLGDIGSCCLGAGNGVYCGHVVEAGEVVIGEHDFDLRFFAVSTRSVKCSKFESSMSIALAKGRRD